MSSRECFNRSFSLPRIFVSIYSSSSPHTQVDERETKTRTVRCAHDTTLVPPSYNPLSPQLPPLSFRCFPHGQRGHVPVVMETRANRDGNSTMALSSASVSLFLFLSLFLSLFLWFSSSLYPCPFLSPCHFQIISRPIMLLLTTRRPLCVLFLRSPRCETNPLQPSLPSRPVSLV